MICGYSESAVAKSSRATTVILHFYELKMKGWYIRSKTLFGRFLLVSVSQEHLKQKKENDVYFTRHS